MMPNWRLAIRTARLRNVAENERVGIQDQSFFYKALLDNY